MPAFTCLLYTSDAADEEDSVDLGGRRIIKKKTIKRLFMKLIGCSISVKTRCSSEISGAVFAIFELLIQQAL